MPGLVPGIHVPPPLRPRPARTAMPQDVDARNKSGHDGRGVAGLPSRRRASTGRSITGHPSIRSVPGDIRHARRRDAAFPPPLFVSCRDTNNGSFRRPVFRTPARDAPNRRFASPGDGKPGGARNDVSRARAFCHLGPILETSDKSARLTFVSRETLRQRNLGASASPKYSQPAGSGPRNRSG